MRSSGPLEGYEILAHQATAQPGRELLTSIWHEKVSCVLPSDGVDTMLLRATEGHFPESYGKATFAVQRTWRIQTYSTDTCVWGKPLLSVNIIQVLLKKSRATDTFQETLWSGFDFAHCCVSLCVTENLRYEYILSDEA